MRLLFRSLALTGLLLSLMMMASVHLGLSHAQAPGELPDRENPSCTMNLKIEGAVTSGTADYLERGFRKARELSCRSILIQINTPGGNMASTRIIVERILASDIPVLCLVSPSGGHAGSAGAIIMMSCHVNGALPATNIGAATPVMGTGQSIETDMREKIVQDTVSWVKGLARLRGRNMDFAEEIVTKAKAYDAEEAQKIGAIDTVALDVSRFLDFAEGREVTMSGGVTQSVAIGALTEFATDLRYELLKIVTDPQIAYLLFMASLGLLYFEITHPGTMVPGVVGGIGLIISLISFHQLNVWWGGVLLIALGLMLMIAEAFLPSFGALGIGGIVAFTAGSIFLYEPNQLDAGLPNGLVFGTSFTLGLMMLGLAYMAYKTKTLGRSLPERGIVGSTGEILSLESPSLRRGMVMVAGEYWSFVCETDLQIGQKVSVLDQENLLLKVRPLTVAELKTKTDQ
jgi:membrane-bound serine protease (ClpP class)